ncbi:MAG TPA: hypothetical protein HA257_01895, partial [Candidatus Methanoperedenaceae archaeon]|nr:hypothetical protein [Candidatus Methanoperedenaceae archaeon]
GWNNGSVTVTFNASDTLSGIDGNSTEAETLTSEGVNQTVSRTFRDKAGNSNTAVLSGINIDITPPDIYGSTNSSNANGWYNNNVTVHFTASDALSGIDTITPDITASTEGINQSVNGTAIDKAGNSNTTVLSGINIDKTKPAITITSPESKDYLHSESILLNFSASDMLSGIGSIPAYLDGNNVTNGQTIDLRNLALGNHTLVVSAYDRAENSAGKSLTFIVKPLPAIVDVNLNRNTLDKSSNPKKPIEVYIEVQGYNVNAIDVATVTLNTANGSVPAQLSPVEFGDYDRDSIPDLMVTFDRRAVNAIVYAGDNVTVTIRGRLSGAIFEGSENIRVIE